MEKKRIVVIGGVAGGMSAAARARRLSENADILVLERSGHVSFANCGLPYHIGGAIPKRESLFVQTPESLRRRFRIEVRVRTEAVRIDPAAREVEIRDLATGAVSRERYDALVLSPGADPIRPPLPGIDHPRLRTLRNIEDMDAILGLLPAGGGRAVVVGGGYIGLEMAEALRERKLEVTLVELSPQVLGPLDPEMATPLHQELRLRGVDLRLGASVKGFVDENGSLSAELSSGERIPCALAVLAIGVKPDVRLARDAGLAIGPRGGIAVDAQMRTGDPAIWAVGDAVEVVDPIGGGSALLPLAGPANRQGRIAADAIFGRKSAYAGTQGTAICKVFGLDAAMTGLSEKSCRRLGRACEKIYVHPMHHAGYYPGASPLALKLVFDPADGRLLGAQAVGAQGADKRIDVLAMAIRGGQTVYDLEEAELCYAPPYGSAKDPVNYAGFVAANALRGDVGLFHSEEAAKPGPGKILLDVRLPAEVQAGTIPGAKHIPLDELRDRLGELPREGELLVFCQAGLRGYLACRTLSQHGFRCRNLTGGYRTFRMVFPAPAAAAPAAASGPGVPPACSAACAAPAAGPVLELDACGLQCPGPILRLQAAFRDLQPGATVAITATDPGFVADAEAWAKSTGQRFDGVKAEAGRYRALLTKTGAPAAPAAAGLDPKRKTIVVFSGDFDRVMASFIIANGAAAMGSAVTMFFTFWGINALRRPDPPPVTKNPIEAMFGWMMPRGAARLVLSKMNFLGAGTWLMKNIMREKKASPLPDLIASARAAGVRLVVCTMSMEMMGIRKAELIDGVEEGGVALYLEQAERGGVNLFI